MEGKESNNHIEEAINQTTTPYWHNLRVGPTFSPEERHYQTNECEPDSKKDK